MGFSKLGPMMHGENECLDAKCREDSLHWGEWETSPGPAHDAPMDSEYYPMQQGEPKTAVLWFLYSVRPNQWESLGFKLPIEQGDVNHKHPAECEIARVVAHFILKK